MVKKHVVSCQTFKDDFFLVSPPLNVYLYGTTTTISDACQLPRFFSAFSLLRHIACSPRYPVRRLNYYDSAPPTMVVSPGAGSYTRHIQQQEKRRRQQLRMARGTGRQPGLAPSLRRPSNASEHHQQNPPTRNASTQAEAEDGDEEDPLGDRRVPHPLDRIRQENPDSQVERAPLREADARLRYYGKLRTMFRDSAIDEVQRAAAEAAAAGHALSEEEEGEESGREEAGSGGRDYADASVNMTAADYQALGGVDEHGNPFNLFLVSEKT